MDHSSPLSKLSSQISQILNSMHEGNSFSSKTLGESLFRFQNDRSGHGPAASSNFWKAPLVLNTIIYSTYASRNSFVSNIFHFHVFFIRWKNWQYHRAIDLQSLSCKLPLLIFTIHYNELKPIIIKMPRPLATSFLIDKNTGNKINFLLDNIFFKSYLHFIHFVWLHVKKLVFLGKVNNLKDVQQKLTLTDSKFLTFWTGSNYICQKDSLRILNTNVFWRRKKLIFLVIF